MDNSARPNDALIEVGIVPKPRFFVFVACIVFGTVFLWNQDKLIKAVEQLPTQVCRPVISTNQWPDKVIVPPAPVVPVEPPKVVVPYTTTIAPDTLVKIRDLRQFYLSANQADGKIVLRTGGTIPWRLNNPGMIVQSEFARQVGSIGSNGKTAIFPTYEAGRNAMEKYLFTNAASYHKKKLANIFPADTLKFILHETGIDGDTVLDDMNLDQRGKLMDAIEKSNGFIKGKVTTFDNEVDFKNNGW